MTTSGGNERGNTNEFAGINQNQGATRITAAGGGLVGSSSADNGRGDSQGTIGVAADGIGNNFHGGILQVGGDSAGTIVHQTPARGNSLRTSIGRVGRSNSGQFNLVDTAGEAKSGHLDQRNIIAQQKGVVAGMLNEVGGGNGVGNFRASTNSSTKVGSNSRSTI